MKAGKVDLAWVGARAFDRVGVTDFQALLAPMAVDSHDLQEAVFEEGIPQRDAGRRRRGRGHGLGVLPGPMRKLLGVDQPSSTPADFAGPGGRHAGLGPDRGDHGDARRDDAGRCRAAPTSRGVDAYEQQLASIVGNGYYDVAGFVTANLDLWPRPLVLIANPDGVRRPHRRAAGGAAHGSDGAAVSPALDASRAEDADAVGPAVRARAWTLSRGDARTSSSSWCRPSAGVRPAGRRSDERAWLDRIADLKTDVAAPPDTAACAQDRRRPRPRCCSRRHLPHHVDRVTTSTRRAQPGDPAPRDARADEVIDGTLEIEVPGRNQSYQIGHPEGHEAGGARLRGTYRDVPATPSS